MDKTETYIKMCVKAEEIQEQWQNLSSHYPKYEGSFYYSEPYPITIGTNDSDFPVYCVDYEFDSDEAEETVWLPRQDELQEMIGSFETCLDLIDRWEASASLGHTYIYEQELTSMEQLWLALLMLEKYGKVWSAKKEEWVKEGRE